MELWDPSQDEVMQDHIVHGTRNIKIYIDMRNELVYAIYRISHLLSILNYQQKDRLIKTIHCFQKFPFHIEELYHYFDQMFLELYGAGRAHAMMLNFVLVYDFGAFLFLHKSIVHQLL